MWCNNTSLFRCVLRSIQTEKLFPVVEYTRKQFIVHTCTHKFTVLKNMWQVCIAVRLDTCYKHMHVTCKCETRQNLNVNSIFCLVFWNVTLWGTFLGKATYEVALLLS